ncbi:endospore germination permease [Solibacillus silvestris]
MKSVRSISLLHIIFLTMTFIGLKNHVTIIPSLLNGAGRDAWFSVIFSIFLMIPWLVLPFITLKKLKGESLRMYLLNNYPKLSKVLIFIIAFYLLLMAVITMHETLQWVSTTFLLQTPPLLLFFFFTVVCFLLATSSILTITMVNVVVLFGVVILGFFIAFVNIQVKDYALLQPFFEHGFTPIFTSMVYPASGFIELYLLVFIQQHFKTKLKFWHLLIMLFILFGLTLGPLLGAIAEFGPTEAAKQRYPAFEEWRIATIGSFINHIDFFSIYQWLTGAFVRIGFILFIAVELLGLTGQKKKVWEYIFPLFVFCSLPLYLLDDSIFSKWKGQYFLISTTLFFFVLSINLFILVNRKTKRKLEYND